jgi:hypothetical protein
VEFPIGKALFKTAGPAWIRDLRLSPRGDLLAFVHHPSGDLSGEVVILDLNGKRRQLSRRWFRAIGLAWSPRNEVWFAAGETVPNQIQALPVAGPERTLYVGMNPLAVQDIAPDGSALIGQGFWQNEIFFRGETSPVARSLSWNDRTTEATLSKDGRQVLLSAFGTRGETLTLLRNTSGAPPQILGEGQGLDLSTDGRWALLFTGDVLTIVPTGAGSPRTVPLHGLEPGTTRWIGGTDRVLSVAKQSSDTGYRLYSIDLDSRGVTPLSEQDLVPGHLEISPDQEWAATVDAKRRLVLHSLTGGKSATLMELAPGTAPAGWANNDELWLARVDDVNPTMVRLIRFDVKRSANVEERTFESGGAEFISDVHVTPDGRNVLFRRLRITGHLYVVRGMPGAQ